MHRRDLFQFAAMTGLACCSGLTTAGAARANEPADPGGSVANPLTPPADHPIPVAFLMSEGAVVIDFAGPWEVFRNVRVLGRQVDPFELYMVAETMKPFRTDGGMKIVPNYTIEDAPAPKIVVIPAQNEPSEAVLSWLRTVTKTTDITMSVCTGAFVLAKSGLLSGKTVTTHHGAYADLAMGFPDLVVKRGARFVEEGNLASSGGLSSGIDLALHVVERYFGRKVAESTADNLEYQGRGWLDPASNAAYAKHRASTAEHPLCPVCDMDVDPASAPKSTYQSQVYYFCMEGHKALFERFPDRILAG